MAPQNESLRNHAIEIWQAGVDAVGSERLVRQAIERSDTTLTICGHAIPLNRLNRLVVVGAGKAGAGMAAAFEAAVGETLLEQAVSGWVNVPEDCVRELRKITLHPARPAGLNEPTADGVFGSQKILELVSGLTPADVCVVLLSGGGSALLPAPVDGISLSDKQAVTRFLMHSGSSIQELNCVRKQLSQIKGGRLAMASPAGLMIGLIISDVIGDPLDVIASGPTVVDSHTPGDALAVLAQRDPNRKHVPKAIWDVLEEAAAHPATIDFPTNRVFNHIIGSNRVALEAAAERARQLGYQVRSLGSDNANEARVIGKELAQLGRELSRENTSQRPVCVLSGGEPVVNLVSTDQPRKGGRNQEVALSGLLELWNTNLENIVLLSGGTDGEDGPTDAAGAIADANVKTQAMEQHLDPATFLEINNAYPFFEQTGGLLRTGPTHTNVMDLRVMLIGPDINSQ